MDADERFLAQMRSQYAAEHIHNGVFGAMMRVGLVNDGPVTIELDSNAREPGLIPAHFRIFHSALLILAVTKPRASPAEAAKAE